MEKFSLKDEVGTVVSIDVLDALTADLPTLMHLASELLDAVREDPDFIEGAIHRSLEPHRQPLVWLGRVPLRRRFVALYCRWRDGHRRGLAGSDRGRVLLDRARSFSPIASEILLDPLASLYSPTFLDATGELCPGRSDCQAGHGIGPIVDASNPRMQFINVFETTPDRQQALLEGTYAIMPIARKHDGYLRTALHRSLDGNRVANYGQYQRVDQVRSMYYHYETTRAFASLMLADVTIPYRLFGNPVTFGGRRLGTPPKLQCYTVERVISRPV